MTTSRGAQTALMDWALTVGQVTDELGVTVRMLHHYDELGLLNPSGRSAAGYRLYTAADLQHLARVIGILRRALLPRHHSHLPARARARLGSRREPAPGVVP